MRKLTLLAIILLTIALTSSCGETCGPFIMDNSLAGSISFNDINIDIEASYDGVPLYGEDSHKGGIGIRKISDVDVSLLCYTNLDNNFILRIPHIPVSGIPYKATLNYESDSAEVEYGGVTYYPAVTTINGWITEERYLVQTRCSPYTPWYKFEINIDCILWEGKILSVKATSENSWSM